MPAESTHIPKLARVEDVVDVMCDAFRDYPVMRFVLGRELGDPDDPQLRMLVSLFVSARHLRSEPMLAIEDEGRAVGAATVTLPGSKPSPQASRAAHSAVQDSPGSTAGSTWSGALTLIWPSGSPPRNWRSPRTPT